MPRNSKNPPKYRHFKPKNLAVVRINGQDIYLGKHGSPESWERYARVIAEWRAGRPAPSPAGTAGSMAAADQAASAGLTINELILVYWQYAQGYYRHLDGSPTGELEQVRLALRPLRLLYGSTPARDFTPKALKLVRESMIASGLCRRTINQRIGRILRCFRLGVDNELVPAGTLQALKAVDGLRRGRSDARESRAVRPVPDADVEAVKPFLARPLWAAVELQRLTGMRSGEVLALRTCDLDTSGEVWEYILERHKTAHHGKRRRIFLGPHAQEIIRPWLRTATTEYLFQPREAEAERQAARRRVRRTPLTPSQRARTRKTRPRKAPGDRYDSRAYAHAVARACDRAFPHPVLSRIKERELTPEQKGELKAWRRAHRWHPHQLRHVAATNLRREFGLDVAQSVLGHSSVAVTQIYAELDDSKARRAIAQIG